MDARSPGAGRTKGESNCLRIAGSLLPSIWCTQQVSYASLLMSTTERERCVSRGLRRGLIHDLRHTFASHLIIDIRLDVVQVSRSLGHARTSMTLDTYTHLFEEGATAPTSVPSSRRATSPNCSQSRSGPVSKLVSTSD